MVICIAALIVLSILGIFSLKYRRLAKEAFDCVIRRITLSPCEAGFDRKMKMKVFLKMMKIPILARIWHKHFELISWIFIILFFSSFFIVVIGIYNLILYGSCDPSSTVCIFNQV